MKKLLLLVTLMFLLTPATISADDERIGELESQIERLEKLIEDLTTENEELKAENEELRLQLENENGQIGVVALNGDEATVKRIKYDENKVYLIPESNNPVHMPKVYAENDDILFIGRVVGMTRTF